MSSRGGRRATASPFLPPLCPKWAFPAQIWGFPLFNPPFFFSFPQTGAFQPNFHPNLALSPPNRTVSSPAAHFSASFPIFWGGGAPQRLNFSLPFLRHFSSFQLQFPSFFPPFFPLFPPFFLFFPHFFPFPPDFSSSPPISPHLFPPLFPLYSPHSPPLPHSHISVLLLWGQPEIKAESPQNTDPKMPFFHPNFTFLPPPPPEGPPMRFRRHRFWAETVRFWVSSPPSPPRRFPPCGSVRLLWVWR